MQRGVFTFNPGQAAFLIAQLGQSPRDTSFLQQKLQQVQAGQGSTTVEMSEEEADILLDNLPMPQDQEDQSITQLRQNLTDFLQKLRHAQGQEPAGSFLSKLNPAKWFK